MPARRGRTAVVVGAGVLGASVARALAGRGWAVTLVEAYSPGHVRASSGGESRLLRSAHGSDTWYTDWAIAALRGWRELEQETGEALLVPSGLAWFARREEGWEADSRRVLAERGVRADRLDPDEAARLFPDLRTDDLAFVLHEPDAGVLRARRAVRALVTSAVERGARLVTGTPTPVDGLAVLDGEALPADATVWACGPWLPALFGEIADQVGLRVTKQGVTFFGVPPAWRTPGVPGWVDYDGATYGLGDLDGRGLKCASDIEGPELDPHADDRMLDAAAEEHARSYLAHRFPALADAPLVGSRACPYTLAPDTNFLIAPLPDTRGVWLVGAGSGHGFKHGPVVGTYTADLIEGTREPDRRFSIGARPEAGSLRTAGGRTGAG